jgi:hypothetical protein
MSVFSFLLFNRSQVDGRLLRAKGSTYQLRDDKISNLYSLELINKSEINAFKLVCDDPRLKIQLVNPIQKLSKMDMRH